MVEGESFCRGEPDGRSRAAPGVSFQSRMPPAPYGAIRRCKEGLGHSLMRRSGRSGAGLGFVRQVVELHRGSIGFEGATGAGNRIRIRLPVAGVG